jgi:hypothetical protein
VTYGGPTDLWGTTLTASDVNAMDFGAAISASYPAVSGNDWAFVDQIAVKVYFNVTCN